MGKYLKQGFVRALEWQHAREEISYSKMVELMEEKCIENYLNRNIEVDTSVSNVSELVCTQCGSKKDIKFSAMKNFMAYCEDCRNL